MHILTAASENLMGPEHIVRIIRFRVNRCTNNSYPKKQDRSQFLKKFIGRYLYVCVHQLLSVLYIICNT